MDIMYYCSSQHLPDDVVNKIYKFLDPHPLATIIKESKKEYTNEINCSINIIDEHFEHRTTSFHNKSHLLEHADNYNVFAITFFTIRHNIKKFCKNLFSNPRHRIKEERWWVSPIYSYYNDELFTVTTMEGGMVNQIRFYSDLGKHIIYDQPNDDSDTDTDSDYSESGTILDYFRARH